MAEDGRERVLLTGGRGFVGKRLHERIRRERPFWEVFAPGGPHEPDDGLDVTDLAQTEAVVRERRPTLVVHLAAISAVTTADKDPRAAWTVNLNGTLNLTEALARHAPDCRLLHISSAEVYGRSLDRPEPTDESALLQPVNPYAASKAAADLLVRQCAATGLDAVIARPFNHTGAGQAETFALPSFAAQIARIEAGLKPPIIEVGDLSDERDFLDVEDVAAAYIALLEAREVAPPGSVFNVASGTARRIGDVLDQMLAAARVRIEVRVDPTRVRPVSVPRVLGDAGALRTAVGWRPAVPIENTLASVLQEQRRRVADGVDFSAAG
jgi:GDP-4-dehydro-6-deoxy-D-mannose reductase